MSWNYIFNIIFGISSVILILITGISIYRKGKASEQVNLKYLSIGYFFLLLNYFGTTIRLILLVDRLTNYLVYVFLCLYIQKTFYNNRKSPVWLIFISFTLVWVILMFGIEPEYLLKNEYYFILSSSILKLIGSDIVFIWFVFATYKAYQNLKKQQVSPWIIFRLRILIIMGIIVNFLVIPDFFAIGFPANNSSDLTSFYVRSARLGIVVVAVFLLFIAWVLPKRIIKFFGKRYNYPDENEVNNLSEEDLLAQFEVKKPIDS